MPRCVLLAVVNSTAFRSVYVAAVYLLYVSATQEKDIFFKARRIFRCKCIGELRCAVRCFAYYARYPRKAWFQKRINERKYDNTLCSACYLHG